MRSWLAAILLVVLGLGAVVALGWLAYQLGPAWEVGIGAGAIIMSFLATVTARHVPMSMRWSTLMLASFFFFALSTVLVGETGLSWAPAVVVLAFIAIQAVFGPSPPRWQRKQDLTSYWETEESRLEAMKSDDAAEQEKLPSTSRRQNLGVAAHGQRIVVYPDKWKLLGIGAVNLMILALLLVFVFFLVRNGAPHNSKDFLAWLIGLAFSVFLAPLAFAFGVLGTIYRLMSTAPALVIDDQGIRDDMSFYLTGVGMLRWDEIAELHLYRYRPYGYRSRLASSRYLGIVPRNLDAVLSRQGFATMMLLKMTAASAPAPILIAQRDLSVTVGELLLQIQHTYGREIERYHVKIVGGD